MFYIHAVCVVLLCMLYQVTRAEADANLEQLIREIFSNVDPHVAGGPRCESISGELAGAGCYDCHSCDSADLRRLDPAGTLTLQLHTESCRRSSQLCCLPAAVSLVTRGGPQCGRPRGQHSGHTRLRQHPADVLPGEQPWLAEVYRTTEKGEEYLCEAVLVSETALVTTARCASMASVDRLRVRLVAAGTEEATFTLDRVSPHETYSAAGVNDVAVLVLSPSHALPAGAAPACLPVPGEPALPDTPCVTVSRARRALHWRVGARDFCTSILREANVSLAISQMCGLTELEGAAEHASPLMCQDMAESGEWTVRGLASRRGALTPTVHLYTDLAPLTGWIRALLRDLTD